MNDDSFLPDGKPVEAHALASLPFRRDDLHAIADGADPSDFPRRANIEPAWGLLYVTADRLGFFVHPTEAPMAMLLRNSRDDVKERVNIAVPFDAVASAELLLPKPPRTSVGKFLAKYSARPEGELKIAYKAEGRDIRLSFSIAKGLEAFAGALASHLPVSRTVAR